GAVGLAAAGGDGHAWGPPRLSCAAGGGGWGRRPAPPLASQPGGVASSLDPADLRRTRRLTYPGLVIDVLATGKVRRVRIAAPGRGLPFGLDIGSSREEVERVLGEPQEATDGYLMYLYSDGFPDTVHFHLRNGGVRGIEWN